jgi:hypothetical protein
MTGNHDCVHDFTNGIKLWPSHVGVLNQMITIEVLEMIVRGLYLILWNYR